MEALSEMTQTVSKSTGRMFKFRQKATSSLISWLSSSILVELEFVGVGFVEGGKLENPKTNPRSKAQSTYGTGSKSNPGHLLGGERSHNFAILASQV